MTKFDALFEERLKKLNKKQREAVEAIDGPVLVIAGPGSGKTEILSLRVGNILKQTDVSPGNILCLTFTDSAAINMRKRLSGLIGRDAYRVAIHTFHSFGSEVIDKNPEFFYNGANFIPADDLTRLEIIENILVDLNYDNVLRSHHPEQGFVYSKAILNAIGNLKKAGLTPGGFQKTLNRNSLEMKSVNGLIQDVFNERIGKNSIVKVKQLIELLEILAGRIDYKKTWTASVSATLRQAVKESEKLEKVTPLSAWKTKYTKKNEKGKRVHTDTINSDRMSSLYDVYEKYKKEMFLRGYYDFDDMLLETINAIENNDILRYDLQEQFQYILVDEFQDTNDAQMRLLHLMTDAKVHEGRPNIMAVGDDDQAVFKFQGAELSNILEFKENYLEPNIITMTDNYRSTQDVLNLAQHIIKKGDKRLENIIENIDKKLVAKNKNIAKGSILRARFETEEYEFHYIVREVEKLLKNGADPNDIAIISRTHKKLENIATYFHGHKIPINYERQQNVFEESHIHQLITLGRYIVSIARKETQDADYLLPEILSYPFWSLSREEIWKIAVEAEHGGSKRKLWINILRDSENESHRNIATLFDSLAGKSQTETLENVFDAMVGSHMTLVAESGDEDSEQQSKSKKLKEFTSPFREYYFGKDQFEKNRTQYLTFLSSLRVFVHALREYKNGEKIKLEAMIDFVDLHEKNNLKVTDTSPFVNSKDAVLLLTAHKAKGMEFETVFVISCQDDVWAGASRGDKLKFPENLPIRPAGDVEDDWLRIFYVSITRAKRNLYLTSYLESGKGKELSELRFLCDVSPHLISTFDDKEKIKDVVDVLVESWSTFHIPPFEKDEKALLLTLLDDYKMPVTHLNNFLDITRGGPQTFLEQNLLRFPQSMSPAAAFGSSMHKAIELIYTHLRKKGCIPTEKEVKKWFEIDLSMRRLSDKDFILFLKRGKEALSFYYKTKKSEFDPKHRIEINFKDQGVLIGDAHITGKIDKMILVKSGQYDVVDFKTGHAIEKWQGKTPYEKIKLHNYKRQLLFYKLLVENSRDYSDKAQVKRGILEFLEPAHGHIIELPLEIDCVCVARTKKLIEIVFQKIMNLDFPNVSEFSPDIKGVEEFEESLLSGNS